jgi:hypothetical protein
MHILKSVGVMSFAKIMGFIYGCIGLIFVPFLLLFALIGTFAGHKDVVFASLSPLFGILMAILMPLMYGVMGFITGAIAAALYNLIANRVGGFEFEFAIIPSGVVAPYSLVPPPTPPI